MKHYKDPVTNQVYAYEEDGSQDRIIPESYVAISAEDALSIIDEAKESALSFEDKAELVRVALQDAIDIRARAMGFSSGNSLMLYAGFTSPYQVMAQTFAEWEASVWLEANEYREEVIAGTKPMLSGSAAVAMMPAYPS